MSVQAISVESGTAPPTTLAASRPYQPFGAALDAFYAKDEELVLSGPAGTGKSRGCLEKLNLCAWKYPRMRGLIVRKTRESLTQSALVTYEEKVLPFGSPIALGPQRRNRQEYTYPNGSVIVVGGLDKPQKVMSTEYDMAYVPEAIELTENDWEMVTTRLRNGVMPYQQLIADTNPDRPTHWLKERANAKRVTMLESRHEDNPVIFDQATGALTPAGVVYVGKLDRLTGPRKLRLRNGLWVTAEGLVYDGWDAAVHLVDRFTIPRAWKRYLVIDFGYTNPFVCQWWAEDPDGRLFMYREIFMTHRLVEDHAKLALELSEGEPRPVAVICDHDAEGRATFEKHFGMETKAAEKAISTGIQAVQSRLRAAGDGRPRLFILRDSTHERDEWLVDHKAPATTVEEVDGYVWNLTGGRRKGEEPVDKDNHGMDAARYVVMHVDNPPTPKTRKLEAA